MTDIWFFLMELVMLFSGAFLLGALAQRLRQSPIIGYLLAGTIVGPLLFNAEAVNQSAELGVALLLFSIGMEFSLKQLRQLGRMAFGGGTVQVVMTMGGVTALCLLSTTMPQALALGAIVALSSTAVVLRVLVDRAEIDSIRGRACLAILLLQDVAIVPLVLMVSLLVPSAGETHLGMQLVKIIGAAGGLAAGCYLLLFLLVPRLLAAEGLFANRELTVLLAVAVGLGAAWAAHALGLSPALGAFIAGILLGESPFAVQIRSDIGAVRTITVTLFFASVGMLAKPLWFAAHIHWILLAALFVFVFKTAIIFGVGRLFGLDRRYALATGITLGQIGEFSFVLAAAAYGGGLFSGEVFDLIVSVIILLLFAAPYMVSGAMGLTDGLLRRVSGASTDSAVAGETDDGQALPTVMVIGFGPAGQQVVRHLLEHPLIPIVVDANPQSRSAATAMGVQVHLGDAANEDVLQHAGLNRVCMVVVTVPDPITSIRIVRLLKQLRPRMIIAVRSRYHRHLEELNAAGADIAVDEESVVGHALAHEILADLQEHSGVGMACRISGRPDMEPLPLPGADP